MSATSTMLDTAASVSEAETFLSTIFGAEAEGHLMIGLIKPTYEKGVKAPLRARWFPARDLLAAARLAVAESGVSDVYFGVGLQPRAIPGGARGCADEVLSIPGIWADIDFSHPVHKKSDSLPPTEDSARDLIDRIGITPTLVVHSGHGLQAFWLFHSPWTLDTQGERDSAKAMCDQFKAAVMRHAAAKGWKADAVYDLARIMRLPGTLNRKDAFDAIPVRVTENNRYRYTRDEILAATTPPAQTAVVEVRAATKSKSSALILTDDNALVEKARRASNGSKFAALWAGDDTSHGGDTSAADMALCAMLAFWTGKDAARIDRLFRQSGRVRDKLDEKHFANGDTYLAGTIAKAIAECRDVYDPEHREMSRADAGMQNMGHEPEQPVLRSPAGMGPPISLSERKPPEFPDGIFGGWLGSMLDAVAKATETPKELAALNALAILGTVCQKRFTIRPETNYFEPLNIWTVCALLPGNRKSAVMSELTRPLIRWEKMQAETIGKERKVAESKRKTAEVRITEMRAAAKKLQGADFDAMQEEIAVMEAELPEVPNVPRLFCQDITPERMGSLLAENGERIGLLSDEGGVFDMLGGRYSNGIPNLDLVLQSHSGSSVRVDRGSRSPVMMNHPALSMGLSPQPSVLAGLVAHEGFRGRGLLARFVYAVPLSRLGYRVLDAHPIPDHVRTDYCEGIMALANVPPNLNSDGIECPRVIMLSPEARALWKEWQREVEVMMREGGRLEHLRDWGGKLPGTTARIAGLLHLGDYASSATHVLELEGATMARAIGFSIFLIEHTEIAFDLMGADAAMGIARRLWKGIESKRLETFTARDAWHPLRSSMKRAVEAEPGFQVLVEYNHIAEEPSADYQKPGRPSRTYRVNPLITQGWR